jgi:coenzyme F420 biosynthesis associated uncharacterized protein
LSDGLVDWGLAERVATILAGEGPAWEGPDEAVVRGECDRAVFLVEDYTGLAARSTLPSAELVGRAEWARTNIESFRSISEPVERRLAESLDLPGRAAEISRGVAGAAAALEVGLAVGYFAQRVIGQYDIALIGPARAPRLLFVAPNVVAVRRKLEVDAELFLRWVALHEVTHAVQFSSVPWLRDHIGALAGELLEGASLRVTWSEVLDRLSRRGLREVVRSFAAGDLATLLLDESKRELVDRIVAVMTVVEGYAEHVMDAIGDRLDPRYAELRVRMDEQRRRRGVLDAVVSRLVGLEMKLAQYRRGKAFADEVAAAGGMATLNRVWSEPAALPTPAELDRPAVWRERVS